MANTQKKVTVQTLRIPLAGMFLNRDTTTKGQRFVNVLMEKSKNPLNQVEKIYVMKRSGLANDSQPPGASATGRGLYYWSASGKFYSVFANKIYSNTTDLGVTLDASSGRCWFAETPSSGFAGGQRLLISDGTKLYSITTGDVVTTISSSSDADFPTPNLGSILYHDAYIFIPKSNGQIWNSDLDSISAYTSTSFLTAEGYPDDLEAIFKQRDQIVAIGTESTQFFFNNGNVSGSPLAPIQQNSMQVGMATRNSLAQTEDISVFVAKNKSGNPTVWMIQSLSQAKKISTEAVERILGGEGTNLSSCTAFTARDRGHLLYGINLAGANRTLIYDVDENFWFEWADTSGNKFNCISSTEKNGVCYLQDASNGRIYQLSASTFQDSSTNFTVTLQLDKIDFDSNFRKFFSKFQVVGDDTTGSLSISYSDDDFANYSTARTIDMSLVRKALTQLGYARRRSWKLTYTDNYALRLEAIDLTFSLGTH